MRETKASAALRFDNRRVACYVGGMEHGQEWTADLSGGTKLHILPANRENRNRTFPEGDVLVLDDRCPENPSFQIRDSWRIRDRERQTEVLREIVRYDALFPVSPAWNRSMRSMLAEWRYHNLAFRFRFFRERARHVDLDNRDEGGVVHMFVTGVHRYLEKKGLRKVSSDRSISGFSR